LVILIVTRIEDARNEKRKVKVRRLQDLFGLVAVYLSIPYWCVCVVHCAG